MEKFRILANLGVVTVPGEYRHEAALRKFVAGLGESLMYLSNVITDQGYANPTRRLRSDDRFHVSLVEQIDDGATTALERMEYIESNGGVLVGVQGIVSVFEQKRNRLPGPKWYVSYDREDRLPNHGRGPEVPFMHVHSSGTLGFGSKGVGEPWNKIDLFLLFREIEAGS